MTRRLPKFALGCVLLGLAPASAAELASPPEARCPYRPAHAVPLAMSSDDYPPLSIVQNEEGTVVLDFLVREDGSIADVKVARSSGSARLDGAAVDAAYARWHFDPVLLNNKPISCRNAVSVVWKLDWSPEQLARSGFTVIHMSASDYSNGSLAKGEQGQSVVTALVNPDGKITDARLDQTSGSADLDSVAVGDVRSGKWRVTPPVVAGKPVTAIIGFVIIWSLPAQ